MTHEEFCRKMQFSPEQAHKELFESYYNYVYTIVFNRLRSSARREDIEECVCDVFVDVYIYYDTNRKISGDISGFIGTIARRKAAELYKKSFLRADTVSIDDEAAQQLSSEQNIEIEAEEQERHKLILDKIEALGEPDATIIVQKYYL